MRQAQPDLRDRLDQPEILDHKDLRDPVDSLDNLGHPGQLEQLAPAAPPGQEDSQDYRGRLDRRVLLDLPEIEERLAWVVHLARQVHLGRPVLPDL